MDPSSDFARASAFQRWVLERTSTRVEPVPWGSAFFNDDFPSKYDANMVLLDRPLGDATVSDVDEVMEQLYEGFAHREVEVLDATGAGRVAPGLAERGYTVEHLMVMANRRPPDREADVAAVDEVDFGEVRPLLVEGSRREPWGRAPGVAETLADHKTALVAGTGVRFFAQRIDGRLAGACELYVHDGVAQVEDVATLHEFRGRGVARNVVLRAVAEARAADAGLLFLFADADDWPQHLYRRLGFDEIGRSVLFTRWPQGEEPAKSQEP